MALVLAAGFVVSSRLALRGVDGLDGGMMGYLFLAPPAVVLIGSAAAAAGRSLRSGLAAAAWATVLGWPLVVVAWLAEAPHWYRQVGGLLLDAEGGVGMGVNLGDAVWWTLMVLALWALPLGVIGARRRQRPSPPPPGPRAGRAGLAVAGGDPAGRGRSGGLVPGAWASHPSSDLRNIPRSSSTMAGS
jgi:hypothetical protein